MADPVGAAALRVFALWFAIVQGAGIVTQEAFLRSYSRGVYCEGIDAATDSGLRTIVERAGVDWGRCAEVLGPDGLGDRAAWQPLETKNREALDSLGLWGVPSFSYGEHFCCWGQDRLRALETAVLKATGGSSRSIASKI